MHEGKLAPLVLGATQNCQAMLPDYAEYYHSLDVWSVRGARWIGQSVIGEELVSESELLASEWYNDLCRRCEIHHMVGAVFEAEPNVNGVIGVHRPRGARGFENRDRAMMELLLPHLAQAYRLFRIAVADRRARHLTFDSLAALSVAVFVVSARGHVRMMNAAGERIAETGIALLIRNGSLSLHNMKLNDRLHAMIHKAAFAPLGRSLFAGETMVVPWGEQGALPLRIVPLPPDSASFGASEPLAAVFIGEPSRSMSGASNAVRLLYRLTPAEDRLLLAIMNGERPSDYAVRTGVSHNTIHAQLKSVFTKTGCHSQADLVRKVVGDPMLRLISE
jgi:DNA-binding CsgD family transcriptional regulator